MHVVQRAGFAELRQPLNVTEAQLAALTIELIAAPTVSETVTVTATRYDEQLRTLPVSIGAVSGEELRHMRPTHVAEPLNRIPGVQIVAFAGEGTHNSVRQPLPAAQAFFGDSTVPRFLSPGDYRTLYAGVSARF